MTDSNHHPRHRHALRQLLAAVLIPLCLVSLAQGDMPAVAASSDNDPAARHLAVDQVRADVALAEEAYRRIHPGYTRYATEADMRAAWQAIIDRAEEDGGMRLGDFYLALEAALVTIRCDHTKAELPDPLREARRTGAWYLPFRWELVEGRGFVTTAGADTGLVFGDELLTIDGRPLADVVDTVASYIPVDGYTDWARRGGISQSREFMGGAVDHFGTLIWETPSEAALGIRHRDGAETTMTVSRVAFGDWAAIGTGTTRARNFKDAVTFERIGEGGAYLSVDTFVNYREPVDPDSLYEPVFQALRDEGRDRLILDLRRNGGGSTDAMQRLVAHLITEETTLVRDMRVATLDHDGLLDHLSSWDERVLDPSPLGFRTNDDGSYSLRRSLSDELRTLKPAPLAFDGQLIVLTSTNNSSGSTNLLAALESLGRATLVGEKTGGSAEGGTAGVLITVSLPESGIRTRLPFFRYTNNVTDFEPGLGVSPDIETPMTVEAFLAGRDPALDAAREMLGGEDGSFDRNAHHSER